MSRGQGALEYLLLLGGGLVVAAIVGVLMLSLGLTGENQSSSSSANLMCQLEGAMKTPASCTPSQVSVGSSCYVCNGAYPKCTGTLTIGACDCGDGICAGNETHDNCPLGPTGDCPPVGGPAVCGNGTCDSGENVGNCPPPDCFYCTTDQSPVEACPSSAYCGDGTCNAGENNSLCAADCPSGGGSGSGGSGGG